MSRHDEIADGLDRVRDRIVAACEDADRDPGEVTLVVITKYFPASDVRILADLGVTSLVSHPPTLEELFLHHYREELDRDGVGPPR